MHTFKDSCKDISSEKLQFCAQTTGDFLPIFMKHHHHKKTQKILSFSCHCYIY